jgi:hypothetical protein
MSGVIELSNQWIVIDGHYNVLKVWIVIDDFLSILGDNFWICGASDGQTPISVMVWKSAHTVQICMMVIPLELSSECRV